MKGNEVTDSKLNCYGNGKMYQILVVEDDADISGLLVHLLKGAGYNALQAFSGSEARLLLEKETPDLILLDLMLPGLSGEELLCWLRSECDDTVPVLVLSAKNALGDKVSLLKEGADDYITKPFEPEEVIARIQAALRRAGYENRQVQGPKRETVAYKKLSLYPDSRKVIANNKELVLTAHEYDILYVLMEQPHKVFSREALYELVWHGGYYGENNTVNVHVSNLRRKLKDCGIDEEYIQTVYGIGFKLK